MNETMTTIHNLRSIHGNFSEREIKEEELRLILDGCVQAANASGRQSYSIIVIEKKDMMKKLCGYAGSKALVFCVDYNRIINTAIHLGHQFSADSVIHFVTGGVDTILAAQSAAIAAKSLGIDSLFTNGIHRGDINRIYKLLDLPGKYCFPMIMLVLGYPDKEPAHRKGRLKGPGVVHYGKYQHLTTRQLDELVRQYDDPETQLALNKTWKRQGFKHYLDWFYTKWSPPGRKKQERSQMFDILEKIGFLEIDS
jgi:nitroreductase